MNGVPAAAIRLILQVDHMQGDVADCDAQYGRLKLVYINCIYNLYTIYYTKYRSWLHGTRDTPRYQIISADRNPIRRKVAVRSSHAGWRDRRRFIDRKLRSSFGPCPLATPRRCSEVQVDLRKLCIWVHGFPAYGFTDFLHTGSCAGRMPVVIEEGKMVWEIIFHVASTLSWSAILASSGPFSCRGRNGREDDHRTQVRRIDAFAH